MVERPTRSTTEVQQELLDKIMARSSGIAEEMTTGPIDDDEVLTETED